jgi:hypothetical protein
MMTDKRCRSCGETKPVTQFWKNGFRKSGTQMWQAECRTCMRSRNSKWCRDNRSAAEVTDAVSLSRQRHPLKQMFRAAKARSKRKGFPFDLILDDVLPVPEVCPVLGIPLAWTIATGKGVSDGTPSLERIVPKLGYVRGNVVIISYRANILRKDATLDEMQMMVKFYERLHRSGHQITGKSGGQSKIISGKQDVLLPAVQSFAQEKEN